MSISNIDNTSKQATATDKADVIPAKPVNTAPASTIWAKMTQSEAVKNKVIDIFKKYDANNNNIIDDDEYTNYQNTNNSSNSIKNDNNQGFDINQLFKESPVELNEYMKDQFGIDNFDSMSNEDKQKAIAQSFNKKYEVNKENTNSNYNKNLNRLKKGEYTQYEVENFGLGTDGKKLSEEELEKYAKMANGGEKLKEISSLLINVNNEEDKKLFLSSLESINGFKGNAKSTIERAIVPMLENLSEEDKTAFIAKAEKAGIKINITKHSQAEKSKIEKKYLTNFAKANGFSYKDLAKEGPIDLEKYAKDNLNLDLSNMTDEEKSKKIGEALDKQFAKDSANYEKNVQRLKHGKYTNVERELLKLHHKKLSDKDIEKYATDALKRQKSYEEAKLLVNITDEKSKKIFYNSLASQDEKTQGRLLAFIVSTIKDVHKKKTFINDLNNAGIRPDMTDLKPQDVYDSSMILANANYGATIEIMSKAKNTKEGTVAATNGIIQANKDKLENGEESQEEFNDNHLLLADNVYRFNSYASEAYKVVEANTTDSNRADVMKTLASHVYQIQDENERGQALNGLTSSKYYTDDVAKSINDSYKISTTPEGTKGETKSDATTPQTTASNNVNNTDNVSQQTRNVAELKEQARQYETENRTTNPINNTNEEHETKEIGSSIKNADENGVTQKEKAIRSKKVSELLDYCFRNGTPSKKVEQIIFNKLSAASVPLIYNVFINCNAKVKKYIFDTKLMTPATLSNYLRSDDMKKIPDEIKSAVEKYKEDNNLDQKRYATV